MDTYQLTVTKEQRDLLRQIVLGTLNVAVKTGDDNLADKLRPLLTEITNFHPPSNRYYGES